MYLIYSTEALMLGFLLDLLLGDPQGMWHPIIAIGHLIDGTEKFLRRIFPKTKGQELAGGIFLVLIVTLVSTGVPLGLVLICYKIHWTAGMMM